MDKKTIGDWIMYHEVQRLIREGLSFTAIGKALVMDRRTVKRYSGMSEASYASFLESKEIRDKLLTPYEPLSTINLQHTLQLALLKCMTGLKVRPAKVMIELFNTV